MSDIRREDPPATKRKGLRRHAAFAQELRENPMRWAIYPGTNATALGTRRAAQRIRSGDTATFGPGFEAFARKGAVFVRYVGTPDEVRYIPEDVQVFVERNRSSKPKSPSRSELLAEVALLKALLYDCGGDVDEHFGTPDGVVSA